MQTRRFLNKHGFIVLGRPFRRDPGFTTCSEIKESTGLIESRQGGSLYSSKSPGLVTVEAVTLTRPATVAFPDLLAWFRKVSDGSVTLSRRRGGAIGIGSPNELSYKFDIDIIQAARNHAYLQGFRLYNCLPTEVTPADGFDSNAEERVMESIVIQPEYIGQLDFSKSGLNAGIDLMTFIDTGVGSLHIKTQNKGGLAIGFPSANNVRNLLA